MYIENRVDDRARSMLRNGPVNVSTHMDNIDKQLNSLLKTNKPSLMFIPAGCSTST